MKSNLLKAQRMQRGWSQTKVAEELGVDTRTVRRWEGGKAVPFPYYRERLLILFGKTAQELGLDYDSADKDENEGEEQASTSITLLPEPQIADHIDESPAIVQRNSNYWQGECETIPLTNNIDYGQSTLRTQYSRGRQQRLMFFLLVIMFLISFAFFSSEILIHNLRNASGVTNTPTPNHPINSIETEVKPQVYNRCNAPDWQSHTDNSYGEYYVVKTNGSPFCYYVTWSIPNNIAAAKSCDFRVFSYPDSTASIRYYFFTNHRNTVYSNISQATLGWSEFPNFLDVNFIEFDIEDAQSGTVISAGPFFIDNCHPY